MTAERLNNVTLTQTERRITESAMATRSELQALVRHHVAGINQTAVELNERITEAQLTAENRIISLNEALVAYVNGKQEQNESENATTRARVEAQITSLRESLDTVRRRIETIKVGSRTPESPESRVDPEQSGNNVIDDAFYVALENHFRGARDLIAERQSTYLSRLPDCITVDHPLIDLGCGRGEWLDVLRLHSIPAKGIDSNDVCILECKEKGLDVENQDLVVFLRQQEDASVGTYTLFQVLEHLPFGILLEVLREMRRTLVKGGQVIAEVPNAKNLRVASGTFWIDPTHHRPLYPELLLFIAQEVGFAAQEGLYVNDSSPEFDLSGIPDGARSALARVLEAVDAAGDFCLIATA